MQNTNETEDNFIAVCVDAIQQHEGYTTSTVSYLNWNPGNLRFIGQEGAKADSRNFCIFPDYYTGKEALWNDLRAKLSGQFGNKSLTDLFNVYAPPSDNNDTTAYVNSVLAFFRARNWIVDATTPINQLIQNNSLFPSVVVCINLAYEPTDWDNAQQIVVETAAQMKPFQFSTRESNINLQPYITQVGVLLGATQTQVYGINIAENQNILSQFNEGQEFNVLLFNTTGLTFPEGLQYGGLTDSNLAISYVHPNTEFGQVCYDAQWGVDFLFRALFHELIHGIFVRTGDPDTLHAYLIAHSGYTANALADLQAVYNQEYPRYAQFRTIIAAAQNTEISLLEQVVTWLKKELAAKQKPTS